MNRKIKNIVMIAIILVVGILSFFTMNSAMSKNNALKKELGGNFSNFNNSKFFEDSNEQKLFSNLKKGEMPNKEGLPENFNKENLSEKFDKEKMTNIEELPNGFKGNLKNGNFQKEKLQSNISVIYYILFTLEGLIISSLVIYLIMSKFNSKTLKETLDTGKKIIIFVIIVLISTIGLTVFQEMLAKNVFETNNMTQFENRQRPIKNNNSNGINEIIDEENNDETNQIEN